MVVVEAGALLEGLAAVVDDNNFLALVRHVQVVQRPVRVNYVRLHVVLVRVEPFSVEWDRAPAVDENQAGNSLGHRPDLGYFLPQVRNRENWDGYEADFVLAQYCLKRRGKF